MRRTTANKKERKKERKTETIKCLRGKKNPARCRYLLPTTASNSMYFFRDWQRTWPHEETLLSQLHTSVKKKKSKATLHMILVTFIQAETGVDDRRCKRQYVCVMLQSFVTNRKTDRRKGRHTQRQRRTDGGTERERQRHTEIDTHTQRQRRRERDGQSRERAREIETHTDTYTETDRQADRQTDRQAGRQTVDEEG